MSARRKPLWRWEPFPYIVLFALIVVTSALQAAAAAVAFIVFLVLTIIVAGAIVAGIVADRVRGKANPDASGNLSTVGGLTLLRAEATDAAPTLVSDTGRHQSAVDAAGAFGRNELTGVLVPGATRWLGMRLRVAVHLVAGERVFHAGFLPPDLDGEWNELLLPLRNAGAYLRAPAAVRGARRPYSVELDLGDAREAIHRANAQRASS